MKHQLDANTRKARKARKGTIKSIIRAGRLGGAAAALVWALFIAIPLVVARIFLLVGSRAATAVDDEADALPPIYYDAEGQFMDRHGNVRLYPDQE